MAFSEQQSVPHPPDRVAEALFSEDFHRRVTESVGGDLVSFDVTGPADGARTVSMVRTAPADRVPQKARKFVGDKLRVEQNEQWSAPGADGRRTSTLTLSALGDKVTAEATQTLAPTQGGAATEISLDGTVNCRIPLVGNKLSQAAEPAVGKVLRRQAKKLSEWLAQ